MLRCARVFAGRSPHHQLARHPRCPGRTPPLGPPRTAPRDRSGGGSRSPGSPDSSTDPCTWTNAYGGSSRPTQIAERDRAPVPGAAAAKRVQRAAQVPHAADGGRAAMAGRSRARDRRTAAADDATSVPMRHFRGPAKRSELYGERELPAFPGQRSSFRAISVPLTSATSGTPWSVAVSPQRRSER
jgi:hypothetical protein